MGLGLAVSIRVGLGVRVVESCIQGILVSQVYVQCISIVPLHLLLR